MKLRTFLFLLFALVVLILVPASDELFEWLGLDGTARADVPDFRVNTDIGSAYQAYSNITSDADGNFIVTWQDNRRSNYDIFGQRFLHDGTRVGSNFIINDDAGSDEQYYPRVTTDQTGRFVVVWQDYRADGYPMNPDILCQRYGSNGAAAGPNFMVNDDNANVPQRGADIDCDNAGNYVVVFSDLRDGAYNIYCRRYHYSGAALGSSTRVNSDCCTNPHHNPRVAVSAAGDFVVVWYDSRFGNDDVFFQLFDSSGAAEGTNVRVNSQQGDTRQVFPDVSCDAYRNFVVAWTDYRNGVYPNNPDIYSQRFSSDGSALGVNTKVNTDNTAASQTEPVIAVDFLGNYIIAWTDSRDPGSTDIWAQYFNNRGEPVGPNYRVNSDISSARKSAPHVTMDGVNIYYTWTDERAGNFDIYARVTEYGAPAILIHPAGLNFEVEQGVPCSGIKPIFIDNTGQGTLHFGVAASEDWITAAADSGIAPDTVYIGIDHAGLGFGHHSGSIVISDLSGRDSSRTCAVTLFVNAAVLELSQHMLLVSAPAGDTVTQVGTVAILNQGTGYLSWNAHASEQWIAVLPPAGTAPAVVEIAVSPGELDAGNHCGHVIVSSPEAVNSPDSIQVIVEIAEAVGAPPVIVLMPESLAVRMRNPNDTVVSLSAVITSSGAQELNWQATWNQSWLSVEPGTGTEDDTVAIWIDFGMLDNGGHPGIVTFEDPAAANSPESLLVSAVVTPLDTLRIQHINARLGDDFQQAVELVSFVELKEIRIPLRVDGTDANVESLSVNAVRIKDDVTSTIDVDSIGNRAYIELKAASAYEGSVTPGSGVLLTLFYSSDSLGMGGPAAVDTFFSEACPFLAVDAFGDTAVPAVCPGTIYLGPMTSAGEIRQIDRPGELELLQNRPNPFNLTTSIAFSIPTDGEVILELFNILGQKIAEIFRGYLGPGLYEITACEPFDNLASGIYFYRLKHEGKSLVKKLVVLK